MQIKQSALKQNLQKKVYPFYLLIGQDHYLLEQAFLEIKRVIKSRYEVDEIFFSIEAAHDWKEMVEEANHYSMFAETVLLNVVYEKKTLAAAEKKILGDYLKSVNPKTHILIRAPNLTQKQVQTLSALDESLVVIANPLDKAAMKHWIMGELDHRGLDYEASIPELIHQYTENNLLAAAQLIEKLELSLETKTKLSAEQILAQVSDQCSFSPFELIDVCLSGKPQKALQILRQAANNKTEASFILWLLAQEIRLLLQLANALDKKISLNTACNQLKIWPQRIKLYEACLKRQSLDHLTQLLQDCHICDERIKSPLHSQIWNALEQLTLNLCSSVREIL